MRVKVWVEAEADADVSLGDVLEHLAALPDSERMPAVLSAINAAHGIFNRVPDKSIADMTIDQRRLIAEALTRQAGRYLTMALAESA